MCTWGSALFTVAGISCVLSIRIAQLQKDLEKAILLRQAERQGRIRSETSLAVKADDKKSAWSLFPIGYVQSVFSKRSGTPRQPGLVSSAHSRIQLVGELKQAIQGLEAFSHLWVIFIFDQNTNISKRLKAKKPFDGLKLLVEPPKAKGKKVGVLACRTPHRPNPVGLSLCQIVSVEKDAIIVSGLDCLDNTPVVDLKPYLPIVEKVETAKAPDWIYQGIDEDREVSVRWACLKKNGEKETTSFEVIEQVLSRDIRSNHQIRIANSMQSDWEGQLIVANKKVTYSVNRDKCVTIMSVENNL